MKIAENTVVTLEYSLHLGDGVIVDKSDPGEPLTYLQGFDQIVPGLEAALEGLEKGATKSVVVSAEEGYGERDDDALQEVGIAEFEGQPIKAGDELLATDEDGEVMPIRIVKIDGDNVTIDLNHPLAGKTLHFSIEVKDVRAATEAELEHGHAHDPHDHHHH